MKDKHRARAINKLTQIINNTSDKDKRKRLKGLRMLITYGASKETIREHLLGK